MLNCRDAKRKVSHVSTAGNSHMTSDILKAVLAEYNLEQVVLLGSSHHICLRLYYSGQYPVL
jgi:hypothetical protein